MATAKDDHESVLDLTRELVAIPSRGGIDPYGRILDHVSTWLAQHSLPCTTLRDDTDAPVALACEIPGAKPGPCWVLDACLDTAPFGNEDAWTHPPTKPVIADGWLWGRGSADSKAGVAIFSHIATHVHRIRETLSGTLVLLFDLDEHTGRFGGAKTYFERLTEPHAVSGVMIGYPRASTISSSVVAASTERTFMCTAWHRTPEDDRSPPTRYRRPPN